MSHKKKSHAPPPVEADDAADLEGSSVESSLDNAADDHDDGPLATLPKAVIEIANGYARVRVHSTHGNIRAGHASGELVWFSPKETDHTVTEAELTALHNDPCLHVVELSNGFTAEHRHEADLEVRRATEALAAAVAKRDRVYARAPAVNVIDAHGLYEAGGVHAISATDGMVRPEDAPLPKPLPGSPVGYLSEAAPDEDEPSPRIESE